MTAIWRMVSMSGPEWKGVGLKGLRIHDLRDSFASVGADTGLGLPMIEELLGHTQAATTQRYAHLDADPLQKASNAIASAIVTAMGEGKESGKVVPLGKDSSIRGRR